MMNAVFMLLRRIPRLARLARGLVIRLNFYVNLLALGLILAGLIAYDTFSAAVECKLVFLCLVKLLLFILFHLLPRRRVRIVLQPALAPDAVA
jgi:hypothetical protein